MAPPIARNGAPRDPSGKDARGGANIHLQKTVEEQVADEDMTLARRLHTPQAPNWLKAILKVIMDTIWKIAKSALRMGLQHMMLACCSLIMLSITSWIICQAPGTSVLGSEAQPTTAMPQMTYSESVYASSTQSSLPHSTLTNTANFSTTISHQTFLASECVKSAKPLSLSKSLESKITSPSVPLPKPAKTNAAISSKYLPPQKPIKIEYVKVPLTQPHKLSSYKQLMTIPSQLRNLIKDFDRHEDRILESNIPRRLELSNQIRAIKENTVDNAAGIEKWVIGVLQLNNDVSLAMQTTKNHLQNMTTVTSDLLQTTPESTNYTIDIWVQISKTLSSDTIKLQQSSAKSILELKQLQRFLHTLQQISTETITRVRQHLKAEDALGKENMSKKAMRKIVDLEQQRQALSQLMVLVRCAMALFETSITFFSRSTAEITSFRLVVDATIPDRELPAAELIPELRRQTDHILEKNDRMLKVLSMEVETFEQLMRKIMENTGLEPDPVKKGPFRYNGGEKVNSDEEGPIPPKPSRKKTTSDDKKEKSEKKEEKKEKVEKGWYLLPSIVAAAVFMRAVGWHVAVHVFV